MKKELKTTKFYPCYPIFIIAYYSENDKPLISTMSSSYSLSNKIVLGIGKESYFSQSIKRNKGFTVNFLDRRYINAIETCGFLSNKNEENKTLATSLTFSSSDTINAPLINEASLVFECKTETIIDTSTDNFIHLIAQITKRQCEESLLIDDVFQYQKLDIPLFGGDANSRGYRFMAEIHSKIGSYRKGSK